MVDGDEFCFRLGEHGGRVNVGSVLADCFFATSSTSRVEILKTFGHESMNDGKRLTSHRISWLFLRFVCVCGASAIIRIAILAGRFADFDHGWIVLR